ncbi:hypothetical protein NPIL_481141 [Nephila pilipes]|uniref:Uncharacterized protein n=1 Tax=Nephila pilipes TaxID=299642 RepID=A0A8X6N7A8_NEPPI|nr:hypothetical protein NPIL_481141 [Nephila pilipes]
MFNIVTKDDSKTISVAVLTVEGFSEELKKNLREAANEFSSYLPVNLHAFLEEEGRFKVFDSEIDTELKVSGHEVQTDAPEYVCRL